MRLDKFLQQLNRGVLVHHGKVTDDPSAPQDTLARREKLLTSYIATAAKGEFLVGVKPVTFVESDSLNVLWAISALRRKDDQLFSIEKEQMTDDEVIAVFEVKSRLETMEAENEDIDAVYQELGMTRYYSGDDHHDGQDT